MNKNMKDKGLPKSIGEKTSEPISFPRKEEIDRRRTLFSTRDISYHPWKRTGSHADKTEEAQRPDAS